MKRITIGITSKQVELSPKTSYTLALELSELLPLIRKAFLWTDPNQASVQQELEMLFTQGASNFRYEMVGLNNKPVVISDKIDATLIVHMFLKNALNILQPAFMALRNLELNRNTKATPYVAQQLNTLRDLINKSDKSTLSSAIELITESVHYGENSSRKTLNALPELLSRIRTLTTNPSFH